MHKKPKSFYIILIIEWILSFMYVGLLGMLCCFTYTDHMFVIGLFGQIISLFIAICFYPEALLIGHIVFALYFSKKNIKYVVPITVIDTVFNGLIIYGSTILFIIMNNVPAY